MRLLIVEDDALIGAGVRTGLKLAGFTVDWVKDGQAAALAIANGVYDAVVLDLGLPRKDGLSLLRDLRAKGNDLLVLVLTARDGALLRRRAGRADSVIRHGPVLLDPAARRVELRGQPVSLSPREFALLHALLERSEAVLSREQLEERVYGWDEEVASNAIEVHLHNLRRKLGAGIVRNVRGAGYCVAPADEIDP